MAKEEKKSKIAKLRKQRDRLWKQFCSLPRRESFGGICLSGQLNQVQQKLDRLEGNRKSKRYYPEIDIEVF